VTGSLSTAALLTGTAAGVVALVALGARRGGPTGGSGPLHLNWPGEPFTAIAAWPVIWVPALLAPIGIFLHVVSIRQSFARLTRIEQMSAETRDADKTITQFSRAAFALPLTTGEDHESDGNRHAETPFAGTTTALSAGGILLGFDRPRRVIE